MKKTAIRNRTAHGLVLTALVASLSLVGLGCDQESDSAGLLEATPSTTDVTSGDFNPGPFAELMVAEIDAEVSLTPEQRNAMEEAVSHLRANCRDRMSRMDRIRGHHGPRGPEAVGEPPMIAFLEDAAEILDGEQFAKLAEMLRDRLDGWTNAHGTDGRPGWGGAHGRGPGAGLHILGRRMADELDLTAEQRVEAKEIVASKMAEVRQIRQQLRSGAIDRETARDRLREIRTETREQFQTILTPEQWEKAEGLKQNHLEQRIEQRLERLEQNLGRRASFLANVLDLSPAQAEEVRGLLLGSIPERSEVLNSLKSGEIEPEEAFARVAEIEQGIADEIASLLTEEQSVVFEAIRDLIPRHHR